MIGCICVNSVGHYNGVSFVVDGYYLVYWCLCLCLIVVLTGFGCCLPVCYASSCLLWCVVLLLVGWRGLGLVWVWVWF